MAYAPLAAAGARAGVGTQPIRRLRCTMVSPPSSARAPPTPPPSSATPLYHDGCVVHDSFCAVHRPSLTAAFRHCFSGFGAIGRPRSARSARQRDCSHSRELSPSPHYSRARSHAIISILCPRLTGSMPLVCALRCGAEWTVSDLAAERITIFHPLLSGAFPHPLLLPIVREEHKFVARRRCY